MGAPELVQDGQAALARADWAHARECFERALGEDAHHPEALDGLGRALHFQGEYGRAIELTERAFAAYLRAGRGVDAADRGRWLAFLHGAVNANMSAAGGWMARAESALEGVEECAAHGWLELDLAPFTEEVRRREQLAVSALAIARRFGDTDLEYDALALLGEAYVTQGRVEEGMKLLDQAMAAVSSQEVTGIVAIGDVVSRLLSACEIALDLRRAEEWMHAAPVFEAWKDWVSPVCRNHYGGILVAAGRWAEAETELQYAIRTFERSYRLMRESPLVKLADLRVRQGRYEEARRLLEGHESHPVARHALAVIALGRRELELAEDLVRLCLEGEGMPTRAARRSSSFRCGCASRAATPPRRPRRWIDWSTSRTRPETSVPALTPTSPRASLRWRGASWRRPRYRLRYVASTPSRCRSRRAVRSSRSPAPSRPARRERPSPRHSWPSAASSGSVPCPTRTALLRCCASSALPAARACAEPAC